MCIKPAHLQLCNGESAVEHVGLLAVVEGRGLDGQLGGQHGVQALVHGPGLGGDTQQSQEVVGGGHKGTHTLGQEDNKSRSTFIVCVL